MLVGSGIIGSKFPQLFQSFTFGVLGVAAATCCLWIFGKIDTDNAAVASLKRQHATLGKFGLGVTIGLLAFAMIFIPLLMFSPLTLRFEMKPFDLSMLLAFLPLLPLVFMEELAFRSYPQQLLAKKYGIWTSQVVMALIFAFYHVLYGWPIQTALMGPFIWAFLFGLVAIHTKGIAASAGIHFMLNLLQNVFGLKGNHAAAQFSVDFPEVTSVAEKAATEKLGLYLHITMLIFLLTITYFYARRKASPTIH